MALQAMQQVLEPGALGQMEQRLGMSRSAAPQRAGAATPSCATIRRPKGFASRPFCWHMPWTSLPF
jgi:hypothetical protein